jgi:ribose 1,5-bisphosphokinase
MTQSLPLGPGTFVAIGGASGVGKDTLISHARQHLGSDPRVYFVRRTITRAPGATEAHISVDDARFAQRAAAGAFAITWEAHGLHYGLPRDIDEAIAANRVVVANISRAVLPQLKRRYANVLAIEITASRATLRDRLNDRNRETPEQVAARLARSPAKADADWLGLDNDRPLAVSGAELISLLKASLARPF